MAKSQTVLPPQKDDPAKAAEFERLAAELEKNGMNVWEARRTARQRLKITLPVLKKNG